MFHLLKPGPVVKTEKTGSDNLLASHGLSKIYQFLLARGHDMYLKGLPESVKLYKGTESCALAPLCTLNPFGIAFEPLKPKAIASFNLQKSSCAPLPQERLGERISTDPLRHRAKPETLIQGAGGGKPKKDKKQKKDKKEKRAKRKASEEPSTATTAPSIGTSPGSVRLRIKQPRLA